MIAWSVLWPRDCFCKVAFRLSLGFTFTHRIAPTLSARRRNILYNVALSSFPSIISRLFNSCLLWASFLAGLPSSSCLLWLCLKGPSSWDTMYCRVYICTCSFSLLLSVWQPHLSPQTLPLVIHRQLLYRDISERYHLYTKTSKW